VPKKTTEGPLPAQTPLELGGNTYVFLFWDAIASLYADPDLTFTTPDDNSSFAVDAWCLVLGNRRQWQRWCGEHHGVLTKPARRVSEYAHRLGDGREWCVDGSAFHYRQDHHGCETGRDHRSAQNHGLWIVRFLVAVLHQGQHREQEGSDGPANGGGLAIAFYGIPVPDPCQGARDVYDNYIPDPSTPPNVVLAERKTLWATLNTCEQNYGETLTKPPA